MEAQRPHIGVGVFVFEPSTKKFILGCRKGSHGSGTYALPGGHLEFSESFEECASREVREETGLEVTNLKFLTATNSIMSEAGGKVHYVTIFMGGVVAGEGSDRVPKLLEPDKCEGWEYVCWEDVVGWTRTGESNGDQRKMFRPMADLVRQREGIDPRSFLSS